MFNLIMMIVCIIILTYIIEKKNNEITERSFNGYCA